MDRRGWVGIKKSVLIKIKRNKKRKVYRLGVVTIIKWVFAVLCGMLDDNVGSRSTMKDYGKLRRMA